MKRIWIVLGLLVVGIYAKAQTKNFIDQPYVEVNGTADSLVTPNEIFIRFTINEKDTKNKVSLEDQEKALFQALQQLGIDAAKNLTVNDMASNFQYYFLRGKDVVKSRNYLLKVTTAMEAGNVFVTLEQLGIANAGIDHVDHSGLESIRNAMRTKAVQNAHQRAIALTAPLHQSPGSAIYIGDEERYVQPYDNRAPRMMLANVMEKTTDSQPEISFEKIKVSANIMVRFVLNK
ncbi:MAG: SIMPL domain-containing protein [Hydrotalea flava]|nr:SIMPL domain-containing protein [Hydrotalea flava]